MKNVIYGVFALVFAAFVTPAMAGEASGKFTVISGKEKYTTAGGVTIKKQGGKSYVVLSDDFKFPGAPDLQLGLGNNGPYDKSSTFTKLTKLAGSQTFELPAWVDPSKCNEFYVWCVKYSVPLSVAKLK